MHSDNSGDNRPVSRLPLGHLSKGLGIIALGVILSRVDVALVGSFLIKSNPVVVCLAVAITLLAIGIKSLRWHFMLKRVSARADLTETFRLYLAGIFWGIATPGRIGELGRAAYARKAFGAETGSALATVVLDRVMDLYILIATGLFACFHFQINQHLSTAFILLMVITIISPLILGHPRIGNALCLIVVSRIPSPQLREVLATHSSSFFSSIGKLLGRTLLPPIFFTALAHSIFYFAGYCIAIAVRLELSPVDVVAVLSLTQLVSLIPVSIAGIGTRDAVVLYCFAVIGLSAPAAVAFSALIFIVYYVGSGLMGAVAFFSIPSSLRRQGI